MVSAAPTVKKMFAGGEVEPGSFPPGVKAEGYAAPVSSAPPVRPDNDRSGDNKLMIYTGGTTVLSKGVHQFRRGEGLP